MTVFARKFAARPVRTSIEAWHATRDALCSASPDAAPEFEKVQNVAASIISGDVPKDHPFVFTGAGPRIRVYYVYDEHAMDDTRLDESVPMSGPFDGDWHGLMPVEASNLKWVDAALQKLSSRFLAYDVKRVLPEPASAPASREITIDVEALRRL